MVRPLTLTQQQQEVLFKADESYVIKIIESSYAGRVYKADDTKNDVFQSMDNLPSVTDDAEYFKLAFEPFGVTNLGPDNIFDQSHHPTSKSLKDMDKAIVNILKST